MGKLFSILLSLSLGFSPQAFAFLQQLALPNLTGEGQTQLADFQGRLVLMSFFEPECSWCYRQMKVFNRIQSECAQQLQPLSVGVNGDSHRLRKELRRAKVRYPAVQATAQLMRLVGTVPATPWTLVFGPQGELLGKMQGYIRFEQMEELLPEFCSHPKKLTANTR